MFRKVGLPILALISGAFAIFMIYRGALSPPIAPIRFKPATSPYEHYVAGEGLVESIGEDIEIGVPFPDLVWEVLVKPGDQIQKGDALFTLDTRQLEAARNAARATMHTAQTNYKRAAQQFTYYERLSNKKAVSEQEYTDAYYAKQTAQKQLQSAIAQLQETQTRIERSIIRAPINGTVLQKDVLPGQFANVNPFNQRSLMIVGDVSRVQLRANVAEEDAWRVRAGGQATAFVRGNAQIQIPLTFEYIEPVIVPKQSLTGSDFERVDTRVLQIIYTFDRQELPVYVGQLLDVYIQAIPGQVHA